MDKVDQKAYILSRIAIDANGCWIWQPRANSHGYGAARPPGFGRQLGAHVAAYEIFTGPVPSGMFVCHKCDNPPCCNPRHLFLGLPSGNCSDMFEKNRAKPGGRKPGTQGKKLHPEQAKHIRFLLGLGVNQSSLARYFGVSSQTVTLIKQGKVWIT